ATPPPPVTTPVTSPPPGSVTTQPAREGSDGSGQRTAGIVIAGVGVVGLAVGTVFGLTAVSKNNEAKRLCPGTAPTCASSEGVNDNDSAKTDGTISTVAMIAGGAALVGG